MAAMNCQQKSVTSRRSSKIPVPVWRRHITDDVGMLQNSAQIHQENRNCLSKDVIGTSSCSDLKSEGVSRVSLLLNNELFQKHLVKHADFLKRHTLSSKHCGLRKSMSNIDLSTLGLQDAVSAVNNEENRNGESSSHFSTKNKTMTRERRKSISCDRPSLEHLQSKMTAAFQAASNNSATAKRRLYIPSFAEFKKSRQFVVNDKYEIMKENLCSYSLDTINEDDQFKHDGYSHGLTRTKIITVQPCETYLQSDSTLSSLIKEKSSASCIQHKGNNSSIITADGIDTDNSDEVFMEDVKLCEMRDNGEESSEERISPVFRSTSDVCSYSLTAEAQRRRINLRKQRQCKSEPFADIPRPEIRHSQYLDTCGLLDKNLDCGTQTLCLVDKYSSPVYTSDDISQATSYLSLAEFDVSESETECDVNATGTRLSNLSLASSNDSGVIGYESSLDSTNNISLQSTQNISSIPNSITPPDIGVSDSPHPLHPVSSSNPSKSAFNNACLCLTSVDNRMQNTEHSSKESCTHRRMEQREIIQEILETELNYGRDLNILKEEFYNPMKLAGLLNSEQLEQVFGNLDDLILNNSQFCKKLQTSIQSAINNGDQNAGSNTSNVHIGILFLESSSMFSAFENYCINQPLASVVLEQVAKEKELLRIFLQVSQNENSALRRMHLKSFLMVPVQRIVKYPLLLNRLYKVTCSNHTDKINIQAALTQIEHILSNINSKTNYATLRPKRKRMSESNQRQSFSITDKNEVHKIALDMLGWNKKEVSDLVCSKLWYGLPNDHSWAPKKCKNVKFIQIHAVLLVLDKSNQGRLEERRGSTGMVFPNETTSVEQAVVVLVREKNGKYQPVRDPLALDKCVVTVDPECEEVFEIQEWGKESYLLKCEDARDTKVWVNHLKQQTRDLSQWRKRRNALPNIMLKQMS
ncbi:uncharacterized protein LOC126832523 [Patella vulgata]|uniref:uncharacterized protein LOC126832523 n=1 Tax=Patella vulgata TaxID=6465 RepID=UPI0024A7C18E|nr:uncharacterized protein LOC126832523 [Patella vulgata]